MEADTITYSAAFSAGGQGHEWQLAFGLLSTMVKSGTPGDYRLAVRAIIGMLFQDGLTAYADGRTNALGHINGCRPDGSLVPGYPLRWGYPLSGYISSSAARRTSA